MVAALATVMIVIAAIVAVVTLTNGDGPPTTTIVGASPTAVVTSTSGNNPTATAVTQTPPGTTTTLPSTTSSTTSSTAPAPPAELVVNDAEQDLSVSAGDVGQATFQVTNTGGSDAEISVRPPVITVGPPEAQDYFDSIGCAGLLAPGQQCDIQVSFRPPQSWQGETYTAVIVVDERTTGQALELEITGHGPIVD